jgi:hypothetical protein
MLLSRQRTLPVQYIFEKPSEKQKLMAAITIVTIIKPAH